MEVSEPSNNEEKEEGILEQKWLHHLMLAFNIPDQWPGWVVWALAAIMAGLPALVGGLLTGELLTGLQISVAQFIFFAGDLLILLGLPHKGISYGPWKAQFFTLALPRLAAALALTLLGVWFFWPWAFTVVIVVQVFGTVAFVWGAVVEPFQLKMTEQLLYTDRLPHGSPAIKVMHISDLHVERLTKREHEVVALVRKAKPDLILITGDYVNLSYNRDTETHAQVRHLLSQLSAPHGIYATLGSPPVDLRETVVPIFDGLPAKLMRHDCEIVSLGDGRSLVLVGMDCTHNLPLDRSRLHNLMASAPNGVPQILLYHSPELMPEASDHGLDLYLCGHTHGGQVRLPFIGPIITSSQLGRRYVMGLYKEQRTHLYVSRGVGLEGLSAPRVRFLSPPEITLFTLKSAEARNLQQE